MMERRDLLRAKRYLNHVRGYIRDSPKGATTTGSCGIAVAGYRRKAPGLRPRGLRCRNPQQLSRYRPRRLLLVLNLKSPTASYPPIRRVTYAHAVVSSRPSVSCAPLTVHGNG